MVGQQLNFFCLGLGWYSVFLLSGIVYVVSSANYTHLAYPFSLCGEDALPYYIVFIS